MKNFKALTAFLIKSKDKYHERGKQKLKKGATKDLKHYTWKSVLSIIFSSSGFLLLTILIDVELSTAVYFFMALVPLFTGSGIVLAIIVLLKQEERKLIAFLSLILALVTTIWIIFLLLLPLAISR